MTPKRKTIDVRDRRNQPELLRVARGVVQLPRLGGGRVPILFTSDDEDRTPHEPDVIDGPEIGRGDAETGL